MAPKWWYFSRIFSGLEGTKQQAEIKVQSRPWRSTIEQKNSVVQVCFVVVEDLARLFSYVRKTKLLSFFPEVASSHFVLVPVSFELLLAAEP